MKSIIQNYNDYYRTEKKLKVYPVEFVVRSFLGKYPNLNLRSENFSSQTILDLGFGDGRNIPFLNDLGFKVYGVEISNEIVHLVTKRLEEMGCIAELKVGTNSSIPYPEQFFDCVLACHSCYYVADGQNFIDNLKAIHKVLSSKGMFICSLPFTDSYILDGATPLLDSHFRIQNDPYGIRNNILFKAFQNEDEIIQTLQPFFKDCRIGFCNDNFYGIHQKVWIVTCWKK